VIIATAVLYAAKDLLLPLAIAMVLAVIFSPIATRLEKPVGRALSAAAIVLMTIMALAVIVYFLTVELTSVAVRVADYSDNIAIKIASVEKNTPDWVQRVKDGIANVQHQLRWEAPRSFSARQTTAGLPNSGELVKQALPIASDAAEGTLIIVLLFFLLYARKDLRDRMVRLAARGGITIARQALESAGEAVGRYLLFFSLINLGYGLAVAAIMWMLGLPNPELWGMLAFLLRFIPYIGALGSALFPTMVAVAVFPGWSRSIEVIISFVVLDQIAAHLIEPFVIGRGIGVAPAALLISTTYWAWLWGVPGLLIAIPLTACLKVAGDYVPPLGFLGILLGAETPSNESYDYYRRLLELDHSGAHSLAIRYCDEHGLDATFSDLMTPAIVMMGDDFDHGNINERNLETIVEITRRLIVDLGDRFDRPRPSSRRRIVGLCAPAEVHNLGLLMVLELLRQDGGVAIFVSEKQSAQEMREFVGRYAPDLVCLTCTVAECVASVTALIRDLKKDLPHLKIIAGGPAAIACSSEFLSAGCWQVFRNGREARRAIRRLAIGPSASQRDREAADVRAESKQRLGTPI
jgi:predicted PurR-regulated permease PerM/methanogenic corrinoid protein MtbC1